MFDEILIGVDGRHGGHDAIALAEQLAGEEARLALAHVYGAGLMPGRGAALLLAGEREDTQHMLEQERTEAHLDAELLTAADRSVGRGLRELASGHRCDLLVVGRGHHGLFGRAFHTDDTSGALNGAPCPVAIAPAGFAERDEPLLRIGVGYDGSPESEAAIEIGAELATLHAGAEVRAIAAITHDAPLPAQFTAQRVGPEVALGDEADVLGFEISDVRCDAVYGLPNQVLEDASRELDLLVIGSRSHGPIGRLFNGSTANHLARNSHCALLVLPRSAG